jgi:hypothetical protein
LLRDLVHLAAGLAPRCVAGTPGGSPPPKIPCPVLPISKIKPLPTRPDPHAGDKRQAGAPAPAAKPKEPKAPRAPRKPSPWPWGPMWRVLVSLLIVLHVAAVFSAPWYIQLADVFEPALPPGRIPRDAQGRSIPLEQLDPRQYPPQRAVVPQAISGFFWHYANLLYINNGYDFFSPDPVFSHLIRYEVFDASNKTVAEGEFPNRLQQWPRLLYHRYMMLVDQSSSPMNADKGWENKIADALLAKYNGTRVHLTKIRHHLLMPTEVQAGELLTDKSTYEVLGEMDHYRSAAPTGGAEPSVSIPGGAR